MDHHLHNYHLVHIRLHPKLHHPNPDILSLNDMGFFYMNVANTSIHSPSLVCYIISNFPESGA